MRLISYYIMNMLPYILATLPVLIVIRAGIYAVRKKQGLKPNWWHELGIGVFVLFLTGLASQTVIPDWGLSAGRIVIFSEPLCRINLIPLQSLVDIGRVFRRGAYPEVQIIQLLGNIGMFLALGFMLPALWERFRNVKQIVLTCFFVSLTIEFTQLFTGRSTDIDDLLLNTLGGMLGFLLYARLNRSRGSDILKRFSGKYPGEGINQRIIRG